MDAYERGDGTFEEIAARFRVGVATARRHVKLWRQKHDLRVVYKRSGPVAKIPNEQLSDLRVFVRDGRSDFTAEQLKDAWCAEKGVTLSRSAMVRALLKAGLSAKKRASSPANRIGPTS